MINLVEKFNKLSTKGKIGVGFASFFVGSNLLRSVYSEVYNATHFDSMKSGKKSSLSNFVGTAMTDFHSPWSGMKKNILALTKVSNRGLSSVMKTALTPFNSHYTDKMRTVSYKIRKLPKHKTTRVKDKISNIVLQSHYNRNIGHIVG